MRWHLVRRVSGEEDCGQRVSAHLFGVCVGLVVQVLLRRELGLFFCGLQAQTQTRRVLFRVGSKVCWRLTWWRTFCDWPRWLFAGEAW
jgi:hypothetical protein